MTRRLGPWVDWHASYDDPSSSLSRRLDVVRGHLARVLDETAPRPLRLLSICAGDGRDVLGVLGGRPDADRVTARLVELGPDLADRAKASAAAAGLPDVDVLTCDAGDPATYSGGGPANVVLAAGIFGNVPGVVVHRWTGPGADGVLGGERLFTFFR